MSNNRLAFAVAAGAGALLLTGCANMGKKSDDPCYGALVTPHTAYNRGMTEASAGFTRRNDFSRRGFQTGSYNGFASPLNYRYFTDAQGKPSDVVYTVTSVNNQVHDIKFKNNSSEFNTIALGLVGLAAGAQFGGGSAKIAFGAIGAVAGAIFGKQADNIGNDNTAEEIKACIRDTQAGNQDYVVPTARPQGGVLPKPQSEGRVFGY